MSSSTSPYGRDLLVLTKKSEGDKFATDLSVKRTGDLEALVAEELGRVMDALLEPTDRGRVFKALTTGLMAIAFMAFGGIQF